MVVTIINLKTNVYLFLIKNMKENVAYAYKMWNTKWAYKTESSDFTIIFKILIPKLYPIMNVKACI